MKHTPIRAESLSDDGYSSRDSTDGETRERRRNRDSNRRRRRKGERSRTDRRGLDVKTMMTPVVKVLLFGVFLSFLDVLYIIKQLEESSEVDLQNASSVAQTPFEPTETKADNNEKENDQKSQIAEEKKTEKQSANADSDALADKEPILKLIRDAGISYDPVADADLIKELPTWSDVVNLYGPEPVIYGLNEGNCEKFQEQSDKGDHFIGTAGTFNSGTNLMSELLLANCVMPERMKKYGQKSRGIRWQVPWGKHSPVGDEEYRNSHKTTKDAAVDAKEIMPMVTIRDPLIWLKSMCRHKYTAHWEGFKETDHCPNFLRRDLKMKVKYDKIFRKYESVLHLWNDYYNEYLGTNIPFLLVRFEDLVFHAEETTRKVCECGGGTIFTKKFKYIVNSAKKGATAHGKMSDRTGYVDALVKYGHIDKRYKDWDSAEDLKYVRDHIDANLMERMRYSSIDPSWNTAQQKTADTGWKT